MNCKYFGICASCILDFSYEEQVAYKKKFIKDKFKEFFDGEFEFFPSKTTHYRTRAEFGIFHQGGESYYTMNGISQRRVFIDECLKVDEKIAEAMPKILEKIKNNNALRNKIFGIEFISTSKDLMAILLYHKDINTIKDDLNALYKEFCFKLLARSRGKKLCFGDENLNDELLINGKVYKYCFDSNAFIQPNKEINQKMISWAMECVENGDDFLEMYCGHGNFTIPLSFKFKNVLATEISKSSIKNAIINAKNNNANNLKFVRISSEELMQAFAKTRDFSRLEGVNLDEYKFSHILVDPPRAGLDDSVIEFITKYENIIYISCNPQTLHENLSKISKSHKIEKFAIFDQFVHTKHIECGVFLKKIKG